MHKAPLILAIDQGTTSSRAIVFDLKGTAVAVAQQEFTQIFPADGWVEHDPQEIWQTTLQVCRQAIRAAEASAAGQVICIGITNQRETTVLWERDSGQPIGNAIVWQDRRTADICRQLKAGNEEPGVSAKTGLLLDPYFSASKLSWLLNQDSSLRKRAEQGKLAFGTIDTFLLWHLTGGKVHATDATNASRTMLFNIHENRWDEELLQLFKVPAAILPEVRDCASDFGTTEKGLFERQFTIGGIAGDQQAATIGQACFHQGMVKSTYGTGCFALLNTGKTAVNSQHRLLTTIAYRLQGQTTYALEGSIFVAGAAVQWLRDGLKLISSAAETETLAQGLESNRGVYLVPAFTGLGAPHWDPHARGALFGLTRDTGIAELVRATLESVCYQTHDLMTAMIADSGVTLNALRVDGGMVANNWLTQFLADLLDLPIQRPAITETTALGAAFLAGLQQGLFSSFAELENCWQLQAEFKPQMGQAQREQLLKGWQTAVERVLLQV